MLIDSLIRAAAPEVRRRFWVVSDLQQRFPERATHCMTRAVEDFLSLNLPCDAVCYLGDSVEGSDLRFLVEMAQMQMRELARVDAPVYYIPGNHDFDYFRDFGEKEGRMRIPFLECVRERAQWRIPQDLSEPCFHVDFGDVALAFFPDHADADGRWFTSHGIVRGDESAYPYDAAAYRERVERIGALKKPVISFSHYSFAGGNRAAPLLDRFLPLPDNFQMHFYGHAHIGDAYWAGKDCYRKICGVDNQPIMQVNVASLENYRGTAIRSAIVEWYKGGEIGALFRNHSQRYWDDYLVVRSGDCRRAPERG